MKQCHSFLQDAEPVPYSYKESLGMKSLDTTCFQKQLKVVTGFTPVMVQCIHQTQGSLTHQMPMSFSKEHVIY